MAMAQLATAPSAGSATPPRTRVFLSYSRQDAAFAGRLREGLEARGIEVFRDIDDTLPGEEWWGRLKALIGRADSIVFVLSPRSVASRVCGDEVAHATTLGKRIFPVVIADVVWDDVPHGLARLHSVYFREEAAFAAALAELEAALLMDIAWVREHSRLGELAQRWQQNRLADLLLRGRELDAAETWLAAQPATVEAPTASHREFIKASRDAARRRRGVLTGALVSGLVVAIGLAAWALFEQQRAVASEKVAITQRELAEANAKRAIAERNQALVNQSRTLVERSRQIAGLGDAETAMLVALEALPPLSSWHSRPFVPDAERALRETVNRNRLIGFYPHGKTQPVIASGSNLHAVAEADGSIAIYESARGGLVQRLASQGAKFRPLEFAPASRALLTRTTGELQLWDTVANRIIARQSNPTWFVTQALMCPNERRIALFHSDGSVAIWAPYTGALEALAAFPETFTMTWQCSPDGRRLVASGSTRGALFVDATSGRVLARLPARFGTFQPVISADGSRVLLVDTTDGEAPLLTDADGTPIATLKGHRRGVLAWAFSPDGRYLATAADDRTARVWRAADGAPVAALEGHGASLAAVAIIADRTDRVRVLTGGDDGVAQLWDGRTGAALARLPRHDAQIVSVAFEPRTLPAPGDVASDGHADDIDSGDLLAASKDGVVRIWQRAPNAQPHRLFQLRTPVAVLSTARFNASGTSVFAATDDRALAVFTLRVRAVGHGEDILAVSADASRIAYRRRNAIAIGSLADGAPVRSIAEQGHTNRGGLKAVFVAGGRQLASIASDPNDSAVRIWDVESGAKVRSLASGAPAGTPDDIATDRTGTRLAVLVGRRHLAIVDVAGVAPPVKLDVKDAEFLSIAMSPDGRHVAAAGLDRVALWNAATGSLIRDIERNDIYGFRALAFDGDGKRLVTLSGARRLKLWAVPGGGEIASALLSRLPPTETRLAFDPTGRSIVLSGQAILEAQALRILVEIGATDDAIVAPHFTSDGRHMITIERNRPRVVSFAPAATDVAKDAIARARSCLSSVDRRSLFLAPEPPAWCITGSGRENEADTTRWQPVPPYVAATWREWLLSVRAGHPAKLPETE
ncbi:MAG: TIR domain-containing protein [Hyphomicrobiaceae bacterium]